MVHCHLAVRPVEPVDRNPKVPAVLSDIVLRLLAKQPEDRYQSAYGLRRDLAVCLERWTSQGELVSFPLGLNDVTGRLAVPEQLYGRGREVEGLLRAFDRVSLGGAGLVLVSGAPGVGKSALVRAAEGPISEQGGRLVEVKFDQYSRGSTYATLIAALGELVRGLLGEPPERVAAWRSELRDALGPNVGVVADVVPELESLMGEAIPPAEEVGTTEAQNRFKLVLRRFLGLFARPDHPLVLFLDDLQWADLDSVRLLHSLVADPDATHLLVVGAYRPEEIGKSHLATLGELDAGIVSRIELRPLPSESVAELVAETLGAPPEGVAPLAALVDQRTGGNPFFVAQLLYGFEDDGLIRFLPDEGRFTWDVAVLERKGTTEGVVELMAGRVAHLPSATQEALQVAAVIGNRFDVATLAPVLGGTPAATEAALEDAATGGAHPVR